MHFRVILRKGRERRPQLGHPWVYGGEIATVKGKPRDGDVVDCMSWNGAFLGRGYFNSRSKIRVRILTRQAQEAVNDDFLRQRLAWAVQRRQQLYPEASSLRLVYAEGDLLPGLTVDRYEDVLVLQSTALGMDQRQEAVAGFVRELTGIEHVYLRNDANVRRNDGLELGHCFLTEPFPTVRHIRAGGLTFEVDVAEGHKTGFYLDQADNHLALRNYVPLGGAVLDAFCYSGAFTLHAAAAGAATVLGLESSESALALAQRNAAHNNLGDCCRFEAVNVFDALRQLAKDGQQFDVVILRSTVLHPPSRCRSQSAGRLQRDQSARPEALASWRYSRGFYLFVLRRSWAFRSRATGSCRRCPAATRGAATFQPDGASSGSSSDSGDGISEGHGGGSLVRRMRNAECGMEEGRWETLTGKERITYA